MKTTSDAPRSRIRGAEVAPREEKRETITRMGVSCVRGIAVGLTVIWSLDPTPLGVAGTQAEERARLARGITVAKRGVVDLMHLLPAAEAELFEPELMILDELGATLSEKLQEGMRAEDLTLDSTANVATDLMTDARARILDAIAHSYRSVDAHLEGSDGDVVLVTAALTPSVVAALPSRVVGIIAASNARQGTGMSTSHAEILAREREVTLAFLSASDVSALRGGECVIVDTTEDAAVVSLAPSTEVAEEALAKRHAWMHAREEEDAECAEPLRHLGVSLLANIGSFHERLPPSAEGIGLVRTELVFSDHTTAPSEAEQFGVICAIAARAPQSRTVIRLFDAGGDKPLPWLPAPFGADAARGIELLLHHPRVLDAQLRALVRASDHTDVCVLVPYVRSASDIADVRARSGGRLAVGALIETAEAAAGIAAIVSVSDFVSIGTNDLSASLSGIARANSGLTLDARLLRVIAQVTALSRARSLPVTVCGEIAGDAHAARILTGLGVTALSVAPARVAGVKRSLRGASMEDCRAIARVALAAA